MSLEKWDGKQSFFLYLSWYEDERPDITCRLLMMQLHLIFTASACKALSHWGGWPVAQPKGLPLVDRKLLHASVRCPISPVREWASITLLTGLCCLTWLILTWWSCSTSMQVNSRWGWAYTKPDTKQSWAHRITQHGTIWSFTCGRERICEGGTPPLSYIISIRPCKTRPCYVGLAGL